MPYNHPERESPLDNLPRLQNMGTRGGTLYGGKGSRACQPAREPPQRALASFGASDHPQRGEFDLRSTVAHWINASHVRSSGVEQNGPAGPQSAGIGENLVKIIALRLSRELFPFHVNDRGITVSMHNQIRPQIELRLPGNIVMPQELRL